MIKQTTRCDCPPAGSPKWLATFADLMSLLMCFFVLLLTFSEMNVMKFQQIAGSMKQALGVQNKLNVKEIPKGTSVIALEFRPGRPENTPLETIHQYTQEVNDPMLTFQAGEQDTAGGIPTQSGQLRGKNTKPELISQKQENASSPRLIQEDINQQVKLMAKVLHQEIVEGALEIESLGQQIIIRIREKGAFASGSGFLQPQFRPIIGRIGVLLNDIPGIITVSGHTDDRHIANELYASNWDLSSRRAVAVAHELIKVPGFDSQRMKIVAMAETAPLVNNETRLNRARNRRVEIAIEQGKAKLSDEISFQ